MSELLVCYAAPRDSDRQPSNDGVDTPDHALIFWHDYCMASLIAQLQDSSTEVISYDAPETNVTDVLKAVEGAGDLAVIVVFGHGECPPRPKRVWNRKREPRSVLATKDVVRAAASSGQVFLACFSIPHFRDEAAAEGVPAFVGFSEKPWPPSVAGDFEDVFEESQRQDLLARHRQLFVDLVVAFVESADACGDDGAAMAREWNRLVEHCRQQLGDAAKECLRLFYDTRNPHYFAQGEAFLNNARILECLPQVAAGRA
jgi:hypothetical protein